MCVYYIARNRSSCEISFQWLKIDPKHLRLKFNAQYNSFEDFRYSRLLAYFGCCNSYINIYIENNSYQARNALRIK